jgi:mannobiose 2-epimerase
MNDQNVVLLTNYKKELTIELKQILNYWTNHTVDHENGGFYGKISNDNEVDKEAAKGAVLNARILWSFSAAHNLNPIHGLELADRAYHYIVDHLIDKSFGGVYWAVNYNGEPTDTKKQVYAVAFTIYALSEYYLAKGNQDVKDQAIALYEDLVKYSYDTQKGGYLEAFNRQWESMDDLRLSEKDANEKKTMNTHLHILEAFTNLYRVWPDEQLKRRIVALLHDFQNHIVDANTSRMILFFGEDWNSKSDIISYGHDIEASWLLLEAAEVIEDHQLVSEIENLAVQMAEACMEGLDQDGGLWYEKEPSKDHLIREKHWWVQAEAMVGFYNAWQINGQQHFLNASLQNWNFVKEAILDKENGEWFWGVKEDGSLMQNEDKAGLWKCPYHNSRACIELIKRIKA